MAAILVTLRVEISNSKYMGAQQPDQLSSVDRRVLGFLVAKGLLFAPHVTPCSSAKIKISDAIKVGLTAEPRVLEVLPAALLHFPRSFLGHHDMPEKLKQVLDCIRRGDVSGPTLSGVPYTAMLRWANEQLPDRRTRPESERKITKAFRLKKATLDKLSKEAAKAGVSPTSYLERLLSEK